jgi:hypothetical protein
MAIDLKNIREVFARQIRSWVDMMPAEAQREPFFGLAAGPNAEIMTPKQMVDEVMQGSELGDRLVEHAIALAAADAVLANEVAGGAAEEPVEVAPVEDWLRMNRPGSIVRGRVVRFAGSAAVVEIGPGKHGRITVGSHPNLTVGREVHAVVVGTSFDSLGLPRLDLELKRVY